MQHELHAHCTELLDLLIVDDDADARELLGEFCAAQGFRVALAAGRPGGDWPRSSAPRPPFPVVIADLHLPHADGFAVLEAARRANASCYVIIVTGYATIDAAVRAVRAGAYDFLAKPFVARTARAPAAPHSRSHGAREREPRADWPCATVRPAAADTSTRSDRVRQLEDRIATLETL